MVVGVSKSDINLEWLVEIADFKNPIPRHPGKYVRTRHINSKKRGCFICGRKRVTRHHIRRGVNPLAVYICWRHHQILHGISLSQKKTADIRTTMVVADTYDLYKDSETRVIKKMLLIELDMRKVGEGFPKFMEKQKPL